jgi:hypothetical protein
MQVAAFLVVEEYDAKPRLDGGDVIVSGLFDVHKFGP